MAKIYVYRPTSGRKIQVESISIPAGGARFRTRNPKLDKWVGKLLHRSIEETKVVNKPLPLPTSSPATSAPATGPSIPTSHPVPSNQNFTSPDVTIPGKEEPTPEDILKAGSKEIDIGDLNKVKLPTEVEAYSMKMSELRIYGKKHGIRGASRVVLIKNLKEAGKIE